MSMNASYLMSTIDGIVKLAEQPAEYCLFWIDWWPICMTKSEWSGWMQAIGSLLAIYASVKLVYFQMSKAERIRQAAAARRVLSLAAGINSAIEPLLALREDKPLVNDSLLVTSRLLLSEWVADARSIAYEDLSVEWMSSLQLLRSIGIACAQDVETAHHSINFKSDLDNNLRTVKDLSKNIHKWKNDLDTQVSLLRSYPHKPSEQITAGPNHTIK